MDHGGGRSYSLWSVPFKIKQKTVEGTDTPYEKGKKIINKPAANGVSTLLGKEKQHALGHGVEAYNYVIIKVEFSYF